MIAHHFLATKSTGHFSARYCDISHATIMSRRAIRPSLRRAPSIRLQWDDSRRCALLLTQIGRYSLFNFSLIIANITKQYKSFLLNLSQSTSSLRVGQNFPDTLYIYIYVYIYIYIYPSEHQITAIRKAWCIAHRNLNYLNVTFALAFTYN